MFLTCTPFFDHEGIARVSLTQQLSSKKRKKRKPRPATVSLRTGSHPSSTSNPVKQFIVTKLIGNDTAWFWFLVLFVFCVILLSINIHLSTKLDSIKQAQDSFVFLLRNIKS